MTVWILLTMLLPSAPTAGRPDGVDDSTEPVRYRGIERLLAKFEAEEDDGKRDRDRDRDRPRR